MKQLERQLLQHADKINTLLARYGVKFGIYKNNTFKEQLFPFDAIPRIIEHTEFVMLERGLKQRVLALNLFLKDIYSEKKIVRDGVVPEDFIFASSGYMAECEGVTPVKDIYSHISGIDLVKGKDNEWYILEDNLRVPSGASYPMIARDLCRKSAPEIFQNTKLLDNRNYADLLRKTMDYVNTGGHTVILTPGRYNAAYFEHSYLAEKTGATLAYPGDLFVEDDKVYYGGLFKEKTRVGCVYRRISDEYMDPMVFESSSLLGVPNVMQAYKAGNVALINAIGNGVADDKGIYYFVPKMIRYYLNEEPILKNAPTYLPMYDEDKEYDSRYGYVPGTLVSSINGDDMDLLEIFIHAPFKGDVSKCKNEDDKNATSIVAQFGFKNEKDGIVKHRFLMGGDAEHNIWQHILDNNKDEDKLKWNIFLAPHHCSWTFFNDPSNKDEVLTSADEILKKQIGNNSFIVSSSVGILDDDKNPPCYQAKKEYKKRLNTKENFKVTATDNVVDGIPQPIVFRLNAQGVSKVTKEIDGEQAKKVGKALKDGGLFVASSGLLSMASTAAHAVAKSGGFYGDDV